jgi:hypothetical protein
LGRIKYVFVGGERKQVRFTPVIKNHKYSASLLFLFVSSHIILIGLFFLGGISEWNTLRQNRPQRNGTYLSAEFRFYASRAGSKALRVWAGHGRYQKMRTSPKMQGLKGNESKD